MTETIAAISTPPAEGGISIVRLSGPSARQIADRVFRSKSGNKIVAAKGYTALYGQVLENGELVDEAIALVFLSPKSYTGEDVVEISCHGGLYITRRVLQTVLEAGARLAQAGEFTKRAFLNGKVSLPQAEAVMDLIGARSKQSAQAALAAREGALFSRIRAFAEKLTELSAHLAAWIDFPEENVPQVENGEMEQALEKIRFGLEVLLENYETGSMVQHGIPVSIVGRPNVGKSTLMNLLSGEEKSIVTEIAGTTRDIVENTVRLGDAVLILSDTAGIRETEDKIEQKGVELAYRRMDQASLVFAVFDASDELTGEDYALIDRLAGRPCIAIVNKTDLGNRIDVEYLRERIPNVVFCCASAGEGIGELSRTVAKLTHTDTFDPSAPMLANERQRECARIAYSSVKEALGAFSLGMTLDAVSVCVEEALQSLLELTGERASETIVNQVFETFCVGK